VTLSLCCLALNEQTLLPGLLSSVYGLADELVIGIDSRSTDRTWKIACQYGARVLSVDWQEDFSYARNLTIDAATGDWILVLDADERLLPGGQAAVRVVLDCAPTTPDPHAVTGIAFQIMQCDLNGTFVTVQRTSGRLFRNRPEIRYRGIVHEEPLWLPDPAQTSWAEITGDPHIIHYGYDPVIWAERGKYARNLRLLEQRCADDPTDQYAREKLDALQAVGN
jgi:glycosyltransferase involved in cell wall biosynthesis